MKYLVFIQILFLLISCHSNVEYTRIRRIKNGTINKVDVVLYGDKNSISYCLLSGQAIDFIGREVCCPNRFLEIPWPNEIGILDSIGFIFNGEMDIYFSLGGSRIEPCTIRNPGLYYVGDCNGYVTGSEFGTQVFTYIINEEDYLAAVPIVD